ncbi:unnamed protein product, partial [Clonostachys byssicola]
MWQGNPRKESGDNSKFWVAQRQRQPSKNGDVYCRAWPKADSILYIPLAMFWADAVFTGGCIWPVWWNRA